MKPIIHIHTISDLYKLFDLGPSQHPLVAVLDFSKVTEQVEQNAMISTDLYSIMFKNYCKNNFKYGRKTIDFQDGNLICIAPNQAIEMDNEIATSLNDKIKDYSFFSYEISEALHLSDKEKNILYECVQKIEAELKENIDVHSQFIMVSTIELLLNYCSRFYGRQLITRSQSNKKTISQIEDVLKHYFSDDLTKEKGLPTVKFLADQVNLSPSYLSDLLKKETGKNAQEHIHFYLIEEAKNGLINTAKTVNEIAYNLGFEYPQYFNKLFKQKTGQTPMEYRNLN
jgi:AraC-like DNA-binding protein